MLKVQFDALEGAEIKSLTVSQSHHQVLPAAAEQSKQAYTLKRFSCCASMSLELSRQRGSCRQRSGQYSVTVPAADFLGICIINAE